MIFYELLHGYPPFPHANTIFKETRPKKLQIKYPSKTSPIIQRIINSLLVSDPNERICKPGFYFEELKKLGYNFDGIDRNFGSMKGPHLSDMNKIGRPYRTQGYPDNYPKWKSLKYDKNVARLVQQNIGKLNKIFYYRSSRYDGRIEYNYTESEVGDGEEDRKVGGQVGSEVMSYSGVAMNVGRLDLKKVQVPMS